MKKYIKKILILFTLIFTSIGGYSSEKVYQLEVLTNDLDRPWSLDFLPNGDILISLRNINTVLIYDPLKDNFIKVINGSPKGICEKPRWII